MLKAVQLMLTLTKVYWYCYFYVCSTVRAKTPTELTQLKALLFGQSAPKRKMNLMQGYSVRGALWELFLC